MSSCAMAERLAPDAGLRFAFCWRVGRHVHSFRIQRGRRSRGVPGRKATHFQSTTTTDSLSVTPPPPHSTVYFPLDSPDLSPCPSASVQSPVRPSFCQSRGDGAPTPIPYILVVPARAASRRKCLPSYTHVSQGERPFAKLRQINEALEECASRKHVPFRERLEKSGGFTLLLND